MGTGGTRALYRTKTNSSWDCSHMPTRCWHLLLSCLQMQGTACRLGARYAHMPVHRRKCPCYILLRRLVRTNDPVGMALAY